MTTKHPRLNVTLNPERIGLLSLLAEQEDKSLSAVAAELIEEALELREDIYLSRIANEIDTPDAEWVSHKDAWK
jgi:hypothetical protein